MLKVFIYQSSINLSIDLWLYKYVEIKLNSQQTSLFIMEASKRKAFLLS